MTLSPLAPPGGFPELEEVAGLTLAAHAAAIKYPDRLDMMLAAFDPGTTAAGVFTRSRTAAAPVLVCREHLLNPGPRALVVNAGIANAFTGQTGVEHCRMICAATAGAIACRPGQVFLASTGVIGEPLPVDRIVDSIPDLVQARRGGEWHAVAQSIMTTDTFPKGATTRTRIDGVDVVLSGIAKGSGMIEPNMATLLAFCFTDASIPSDILQQVLAECVGTTFNAITVDGDTSTSDSLLLFATGAAGNRQPRSIDDPALDAFKQALTGLLEDLAIQVVRDGEGASKLIEIRVTGARDDAAARIVAASIANSPLVKTAIAGEDANWGRIVMAVGKAGQEIDPNRLNIMIGGVQITENGERIRGYDEVTVSQHLKQDEIRIAVDLGMGSGIFMMWTCDLTHGYITINADYRS